MKHRPHRIALLAAAALVLSVAATVGVLALTGVLGGDDARRLQPSPALAASGGATDVGRVYDRASPAVVSVEAGTETALEPGGGGRARGSGFLIDRRGTIVTNAHVVDDARQVRVRFDEDDDPVDARVLGADASTDLAVLRVDAADVRGVDPLALADSTRVRVGDLAVAIGNPFGLDRSATAGIVSAVDREIDAPNGFEIANAIQTDAAINPGNSGGPLLDRDARLIGVNTQIATAGSRGNVGVGFAVPSNTVREVVPDLEDDGRVEHAYLGVSTSAVTPDVARELGLSADHGALIRDTVGGGPAERAGLRAARGPDGRGGDVIVAIAGRTVRDPEDVAAVVATHKPGDHVALTVQRGDERTTVEVTLGRRPERVP